MSTDQETTIFTETAQADQPEAQATNETGDDYRSMYVGEGKKYSDEDKAFKALHYQGQHISQIESENAQLREQLAKATKLEELLLAKKEEEPAAPPQPEAQPQEPANDIDSLLDRKLEQREMANRLRSNIKSVDAAMKEAFGGEAQRKLVTKANEYGMPIDKMMDIAGSSPKAFLAMFDIKDGAAKQRATTTSDVRIESEQKTKQPPKTVMGGASRAELLDSWRAARPAEA